MRHLIGSIVGGFVLTAAAQVHAAPCADRAACDAKCEQRCVDVVFPSAVKLEDKTLCLNGMGVREATVFNVDVYVAGLYLERRGSEGDKIANSEQAKLMRLRFVRDVSRSEIREAIADGFQRSAGAAFPRLKASIDRFTSSLPEFKSGDVLTLAYRPGRGLEMSHGQKRLVEIPSTEFAATLFRIWLGAHPPNAGLRTGLLGGRCE